MIPMFKVAVDVESAVTNLRNVLESGYVGEGPRCAELEAQLSSIFEMDVLLTNSGTSALRLALHLAGAAPGTDVITTPQTCLATNTAIKETGARLIWADIDPQTGNIDPADVVRKVTPSTVAIMAVDWAGRLCDFAALRERTRGVAIIEDAAHAFGATRLHVNKKVCLSTRGDFVAWSYQAIKHFTTGDGGGLSCPGRALHERARLLRWFGLDRSRSDSMRCYQNISEAGFKMQSNDIAAAIGLANLPGAFDRVARCREVARRYQNGLASVPYVTLPEPDDDASWWFYPIKVSRPFEFERFMKNENVTVGQVHARNDTNRCFDAYRSPTPLPGVDFFSAHQTNLPCGWFLSNDDVDHVVAAVDDWSKTPEARW